MSSRAGRLRASVHDFLAHEAAGGIALIGAAALAMLAANLPGVAHSYFGALAFETGPVLSAHHGPMTVHLWINDALMAIFFLFVGLEIKREFVGGRLSTAQGRRLPVLAAAAGMAMPALLYLLVTASHPEVRSGWAIPAATDIAFALGVLALLGSRVPTPLKLLLTTVAIVDDLGAVAVIALAYTAHIELAALAGAGAIVAAMAVLNRCGVHRLWPYLLLGVVLWYCVFLSGVHATVAGVATAMLIPIAPDHDRSPLHRLEHGLSAWVSFAIVPLFGFANAGVALGGFSPAVLLEPLPLGIALALLLGKQAGIFTSIWLAARTGFAPLPGGASWRQVYGLALLTGIGFTMSLFIGGLAFPDRPELIDEVKIGVLAGSILSAILGYAVLRTAPSLRSGADTTD